MILEAAAWPEGSGPVQHSFAPIRYLEVGAGSGTPPEAKAGRLKLVATIASGELFEQSIQIQQDGACLTVRRVVLRLFKPTRHDETEMAFLTNLGTRI